MTHDHESLDFDESTEDLDLANLSHEQLVQLATGTLLEQAVEIFETFSKKTSRNTALGVTLQATSLVLGNLTSLVHEDHQREVLEDCLQVIERGLIDQLEIIAEMSYGAVGHC